MPVDLDGDGALDIGFLDYTNGRVAYYFGAGDGRFAAAQPVCPPTSDKGNWAGNIEVITSGDFNGDGNVDVLVYRWEHASAGGPADLLIGLNDGAGAFTFRPALPAGRTSEIARQYGPFSIDPSLADFNGDKLPDLILRAESAILVLLANPDGSFNPEPVVALSGTHGMANYLATGDANGDGIQDIVLSNPSKPAGVFTLLGDGNGRFRTQFSAFGNWLFMLRLGDLNGDGKADLAVADLLEGGGFNLDVLPGKGDGTFDVAGLRTVLPRRIVSNILLGDYNGDARPDLIVSVEVGGGAPAGILLLPSNGDLTFGAGSLILDGVRTIWNGTRLADLNGDGLADLVAATYGKTDLYAVPFGMIAVANQGNGRFAEPVSELMPLDVAGRNAVPFVADINRDGAPDVILGSGLSSPVYLNRTRE